MCCPSLPISRGVPRPGPCRRRPRRARRPYASRPWRGARALLRAGRTARIEVGGDADTCPERLSVLVHTHAPRPRMLIFGAVDFAAALSQAGRFLGYSVTVCDARPVFATTARFPHADEVVVDWPTATWPSPGPTPAPPSASSLTTPSSTSPCCVGHCPSPSATSAPWARDALTSTASTCSGKPASPRADWPVCTHRSAWASVPVRPRRRRSPSLRRSVRSVMHRGGRSRSGRRSRRVGRGRGRRAWS